jgi:nucleotide-binding universal stress UspA family protein
MLSFKKILAPTDFSEASCAAIEQAAELADRFESELCLVHVVEPMPSTSPDFDYGFDVSSYEPGLYASAEERLQEIQQARVARTVASRCVLCYGEPAREIVRVGQEEATDLIVIATHGLTGWRHLVFGSVAEKVVRMACCPVLTLRLPDD